MKSYYTKASLSLLCALLGKTRQAYYETNWRKAKMEFNASVIVELVRRERKVAKRVGGKKLYRILKDELLRNDITIGRDLFLGVLREHGLLVKRRRRYVRTTMSRHRFLKYPNYAKQLKIDRSEQLWVSDITYMSINGVHYYLILITDAYSRKVVGFNFGAKMDAKFCTVALQMAFDGRSYPSRQLMHHSDRGVQYCSKLYTDMLKDAKVKISMTEKGDPLENPLAERMNRTFKDVFGLDQDFESFEQAEHAVIQAVEYYNTRLPHLSIDRMTPEKAHHKTGEIQMHWKWYWKEKQEKQEKTKNENQTG